MKHRTITILQRDLQSLRNVRADVYPHWYAEQRKCLLNLCRLARSVYQ